MKTEIVETVQNTVVATYDFILSVEKGSTIQYKNIAYTVVESIFSIDYNTMYIYIY